MNFNLYDLQSMYQKYLFDTGYNHDHVSISLCGHAVIPIKGEKSAVFLLARDDQKDANFFGTTSCDNNWGCPVCSSKLMLRHGKKIAAAIDALEQKNQVAIMITLTILHDKFMTCYEATEILHNSWKALIKRGNKLDTKGRANPYARFRIDTNSTHHVRVCEFTYGKSGWHPHFHCLYWVDRDKLHIASQYEKILREHWYNITKKETLKIWAKTRPQLSPENAQKKLKKLWTHADLIGSNGVHFSRDDKGRLIIQKSSNYICGWSADKEVTGCNYKHARENHYTPMQILQVAWKNTGEERKRWLDLYEEYVKATTRGKNFHHSRIMYSVSGLSKIISDWMKTHEETFSEQKKFWHVVCTFPPDIWLNICILNETVPIKKHILELALLPDARNLIAFYLSLYDIILDVKEEHRLSGLVEDIFNHTSNFSSAA